MRKSWRPLLALCLGLLLSCSAAHATNLLVNGNFATGDLTGWSYTGAPSAVAGAGYYSHFSMDAAYGYDNSGYGYLSQTFATKIGDTYAVSLLSWSEDFGGGVSSDNINGDAPFFDDGLQAAPLRDIISTNFVATSATSTLNLGFHTHPGEGLIYFADASVTDITPPPTATPEPASLTLALSGLLALALFGSMGKITQRSQTRSR